MDGKRRWATPTAGVTPALQRLWRTIGPEALDPSLAEPLLAAVAAAHPGAGRVGPTPEEDLRAIHEARTVLAQRGLPHPDTDVAATVVLACALRGDAKAARFLADALDRLASSKEGGTHHVRFARQWRARSGRPPPTGDAGRVKPDNACSAPNDSRKG